MRNIQYLTIDINKKSQQDITANEGEVGSRFLKIKIIDNNVPVDLNSSEVFLYALKPDNTKVFNATEIVDATQGIVLAELTSQLLNASGIVKLTLVLTEGANKLISKEFSLKVDDSIFDDSAIVSTNEFTALTTALGQVQNIDNRFNEVNAQFNTITIDFAKKNEVGSPLIANSVSEMTDKTRVYVNTTDGNWYSWNGTNWVIGGLYNSQGIGNKTITERKTSFISMSQNGNLYNLNEMVVGRITETGTIDTNSSYTTTDFIKIYQGFTYSWGVETGLRESIRVGVYNLSKEMIDFKNDSNRIKSYTATQDGYLRITYYGSFPSNFMVVQMSESEYTAKFNSAGTFIAYDETIKYSLADYINLKSDKEIESLKQQQDVLTNRLVYEVCSQKNKLPLENISAAASFSNTKTLTGVEYSYNNECFRYSLPYSLSGTTINQNTPIKLGYTVEFYYTGSEFEVIGLGGNTRIMVQADNEIVTDKLLFTDNYSKVYIKVNMSTAIKRYIKLFVFGSFGGIIADSVGKIEKYTIEKPRLVVEGDSIVEGTSILTTGNNMAYCWASIMSQYMDWDIYNCGIGGSGYVKTGNTGQPNLVDRFDVNVLPYTPDVFIASAGLNDTSQDLIALETNIDAYWKKAKNDLNTKNIIMISPFNPKSTVLESLKPVLDLCKKTALKYNIPYLDIANGITYDANGAIISNFGHGLITDANITQFISSDNTHPTKEGHKYIGKIIANEVWKILKNDFGLSV